MKLFVTSLICLDALHRATAFGFIFDGRLLPLSVAKSRPSDHSLYHENPKRDHLRQMQLYAADGDDDSKKLHSENSIEQTSCTINKTAHDVPNPPRYLRTAYNMATLLNILSAIALSLGYSTSTSPIITSITASTATSLTRYQPNSMATYTAGALGHFLLVGATSHILAESVETKRLFTSDTYKRLNTGMLLFGLLGLCSFPGEAGCNSSSGLGVACTMIVTQLSKATTALVSYYGWEYSVGGFGSSFKERSYNIIRNIRRGINNIFKNLLVTEERPATFYRTFFLLVTILNPICNIPELSFNIRQGVGLFSLPVSLNLSSMARLGLLSVILYVLKDAADRDRLDGSTFIKLNMSVGLWALGVGMAQGYGQGEFNLRRAADKFLFGALFLNNGIISILRKMGLMKKGDPGSDSAEDPPLRINLF